MTKFKKIGEIHGFKKDIDKEVLETLENQGLLIVDDDERNEDWKVYHILKEVSKQMKFLFHLENFWRIYRWR